LQGVIKAYDRARATAYSCADTDLSEYDLAEDALVGSVFRSSVKASASVFELDPLGRATHLRLGSEVDMGTPASRPLAATRSPSSQGERHAGHHHKSATEGVGRRLGSRVRTARHRVV